MHKTNCQEVGEKNRFIQCSETKIDSMVLPGKEKIMKKTLHQ